MTQSTRKKHHWKESVSTGFMVSAIISATLFAGLGLRFQSDDIRPIGADSNMTTVNTLVAERSESIEESFAYSGVVKAGQTVELSFDRAGRVTELLVPNGSKVAANAPLAELEKQRLESRQTSLRSARDRAAESLASLDPDTAPMTTAAMQATITDLRNELNRLNAEIAVGARTAAGQTPAVDLQQQVRAVQSRVQALNETSRQQKIEGLRERIGELDGQLADLAFELAGCRLTAPFAGVVHKFYVDEGSVVSAGMPIVRLIAADSPEVWLGIPAALAATLEVGRTHEITVNNKQYRGVLIAKLPEIDRTTRALTTIFRLDVTLSDEVLPGQVARVELTRSIDGAGFWLPLTAMMREARGLWSIYVVERQGVQQIVSRRYVEVVHLQDTRALVRGTLESGDQVIVEGTHRVVPGQQVRCIEVSQATEPMAIESP